MRINFATLFTAALAVIIFLCMSIGVTKKEAELKTTTSLLTELLRERMRNINRGKFFFGNTEETHVVVASIKIEKIDMLISGMQTKETVDLLNMCFSMIGKSVEKHGGYIETITQDGITAIWKCEDKQNAAEACDAAMDIVARNEKSNLRLYSAFGKEVSFSAGIGAGDAIIGKIGSQQREIRVIGAAEYIAARLQRDAPAGNVYISETVKEWAGNKISVKEINQAEITGNIRSREKTYRLQEKEEIKANVPDDSGNNCNEPTGFTLYFLGCRGSYHVSGVRFNEFGGQTTCMIMKKDDYAIVVDCGTGLYEARTILQGCKKIDVVISHVHYDHCLGLLDWTVFPKEAELNFYGNFRGWCGIRTIHELFSAPFWPVDPVTGSMHQIPEPDQKLILTPEVSVLFFPAPHPNGAELMQFEIRNMKISMMVDCERSDGIPIEYLKNTDILIYDAMYSDEEYPQKVGWGHSTWQEGCRLAKKANIDKLILTHHSPQRTDAELRKTENMARKIFQNTYLARSGMEMKL